MKTIKFILLLLFLNSCNAVSVAQNKNGFDLNSALIPVHQIFGGGPPKDGIPAIDQPEFLVAEQADYLQDDSAVLGINYHGISKAYPI